MRRAFRGAILPTTTALVLHVERCMRGWQHHGSTDGGHSTPIAGACANASWMAREPHRRRDVDNREGIPEPLLELQRTSKTVELCGQEHDRKRCMRSKGHDGTHECLGLHGPVRWQ